MAYYLDWGGHSNDVRVELASPIILSGDFSLSISFSSSTNGSFMASGGTSTGGLEFYRNSSGRLQVFLSGSSRFSGSSAISNDKSSPSELIIERVGAQISFTLDGVLQGSIIEAGDLYISTIGERPNGGWVRSPEMSLYSLVVQGLHNYDPSASSGTGQLIDTVSGNHGTPSGFSDFEAALIYYDNGSSGPEPQPEMHEFSGNALVNASISASASKVMSFAGDTQVSVLSQSSLSKLATLSGASTVNANASASATKVVAFSGQSTVNVSSVSLFEKVTTFTGTASVDVTSQSDFSKRVAFGGEATVNVTASGVLFDENFEIHTFAGGATISVSTSGQAIKVGLVSGESRVNATTTAQAQKVASLSGNAQVAVSTQSAFSKLASLAGNAITRITTAATITKRVLLNGASTVLARVSGTFFNTDSNVETYETTIEGRVKAPLVVKGTVKSLTIEGRVK